MFRRSKEQSTKEQKEKNARDAFYRKLNIYLVKKFTNNEKFKEFTEGKAAKENTQNLINQIIDLIKKDYSGKDKELGADELKNLIQEKFPSLKDLFIEKIGVDGKVQENIKQQEEFEEKLDPKFFNIVQGYCLESPEAEGNFPNKLETPEAVRAYLYFLLPDKEREPFKGDFQRLVSAKEEFDPNKFFKEIDSFIEDFMEGKKKESINFPKEWLPNELKKHKEEELKKLGIESRGDKYVIVVTPEQIKNKIDLMLESKLEISEKFREIGEKIISAQNLSKEAKRYLSSIPEGKSIATAYDGLLASIKNSYIEGIRSGMSEEEARKLLDSVTKLESQLKFLAERGKSAKSDVEKKRLLSKAKDWLKANGGTILSGIGFLGLAVFWFLPLWLISKMYDQIEQGGLIGKKK
jgi:hypothetical protein